MPDDANVREILYAQHKRQIDKIEMFLKMADINASIYIDDPNYYTSYHRFMLIVNYLNGYGYRHRKTICYKSIDRLEAGAVRLVERTNG
jgi:hypothetical protein